MGNFLRNLFGSKKSPVKIKPRMQSRRLELIGLEERITPAAFTLNGQTVVATLAAGESLTAISSSIATGGVVTINVTSSLTNSVVGTGLAQPTAGVAGAPSVITFTPTSATSFTGISILGSTGNETVAISGAVDLNTNGPTAAGFSVGTSVENLTVAGAVTSKSANISLAATAVTLGANLTADTSGAITVTGPSILSANVLATSTNGAITLGTVAGPAFNLTTVSGSGAVSIGVISALTALSITSTGPIGLTGAVNAGSVTTVNAGAVTLGGTVTTTGLVNFAGAVTGTTSVNVVAGTTATFGSTVNTPGAISVLGLGDLTFTGSVGNTSATSVTAKSLTGNVIFGDTVTSSNLGGFISEATSVTKATKIANLVTLAANANAVVTGNLISNNATLAAITTSGVGNITITGNVDASVANNALTLTAGSAVSIGGNVGSGAIAFGTLTASGTGTFLAAGTVTAGSIKLDQSNKFATSITFAKAVTVSDSPGGIEVNASGSGTVTFSDTITALGAAGNNTDIEIISVNGVINVGGAITGLDKVAIISNGSGSINLSGNVTTSGNSTTQDNGLVLVQSTTGNITTVGVISTSGSLADIEIDTATSGNITIGGNVSTSGGGDIFLGADSATAASGTGNLTINGTVITTGTAAGDIVFGIAGGTGAINKAVTAGTAGDVIFLNNLATDAYTIVSGANISAGDNVIDAITSGGAAGIINLGANVTALNGSATSTLGVFGIGFDNSINLTGAVSMKAAGTGGDISLASVDGFQNLTLETPAVSGSDITLFSVGQTTALSTLTITNSGGFLSAGNFNASVVVTDTTGSVQFNGASTVISQLTTAAKAYSMAFGVLVTDSTVIYGAPVFLNTGNVSFTGNTSLVDGATITGSATTNVSLSGTIITAGSFNIGALPVTTIADGTDLGFDGPPGIRQVSTFAGVVTLASTTQLYLTDGELVLSGDSSSVFLGNINLFDSFVNVTGKIGSASTIFGNLGTIFGSGGTIGNLIAQTITTVDPEGTLNTGVVTFNAATTYIADVLTTTTATNLTGNAGFSLGGATLSLSSVASGLAAGNSFTIINNTAVSGGLSGTFAGLPEGATLSALDSLGNTITFAISYVGGIIGANDVTLTVTNVSIANPSAIPQPMVAGQPQLNYLTVVGAGAGGGPMVTVTLDIIPGLTTVPTYFSFFAYDEGFTGGVHVALNELDGNTDTKEIITGAGAGGGPNVKVFQFNIRTLTFNPTPVTSFFAFNDPAFTGGVYVAGGDVTGDGIGDLLVGAGEGGGPRVQVYAGSVNGVITSAPISDFFAYSTEFLGGVVVAAGDRTGDATLEVVTGPASNGGYNIKSFNVAGTGNNPTLIENFFAFNDFTSIGGLSIATAVFDANPMDDLVIGTTNTQFGIILNQDYEGIQANPFPGFDGEIRAGFVSSVLSQTYQAVAAAGPGGGPVLSVFIVDPINLTLTQTDSLFVFDPEFTGGLFVAN